MNMKTFLCALNILMMGFFSTACTTKQTMNKQIDNKTETSKMYNLPQIPQYKQHVVKLSEKDTLQNYMVELIPGKMMEVDCNRHFLNGDFETKEMNNGSDYYIFKSDGYTMSTRMGCPENDRKNKFITGKTLMQTYNPNNPYIVYTPEGMDLKYRIWKAGKTYIISKNVEKNANNETFNILESYPSSIKGYDRYVLLLTPRGKTQQQFTDLKVEIIPGVVKKVDCNKHGLVGKIEKKTVEGYGYDYYMYKSEGKYYSTRMGCPDNSLESKFITGETEIIDYNDKMPVVIYVPNGFEIRYRVWEAPALQ